MDIIRLVSKEDKVFQKLKIVFEIGKWNRKDLDLILYYDVRVEIYEFEGVLLRFNRIILLELL